MKGQYHKEPAGKDTLLKGKGQRAMPGSGPRVRLTGVAVPILGLVGMGISSYLTYVDLKGIKPVCLPLSDCNAVLSSAYSHFMGIPLALLGLLMYTVLTCLGLLLLRKKNEGGLMALATFSLALTGTLYSGYLFYLQLSEIHAFCTWCLASALVVTAITALSLRRLFTSRQYSAKTHTSA